MSDQFSPIRPKQVPLSHAAPEPRAVAGRGASLITWGLGILLAVGLVVLVFWVVPSWVDTATAPAPAVPAVTDAGPAPGATAAPEAEKPELPPFQALQREQAREQAQERLARFVELQIQLERDMQVGAWGADAYRKAKDLAAAGDQQFLEEQFESAIASYEAATKTLAELIEQGRKLLEESIAEGQAALAARDQARAEEAFALAGTIAPDDPRVAAGKARAALLPEISNLMRQGRNHELAEAWDKAAEIYAQVEKLDSATHGLKEALQRVAEGRKRTRVQQLLSEGFNHLAAARFGDARSAFDEVLDLEPGNAVATSGLEQVERQSVIARINALKEQADRAAADERWEQAAKLYGKVLEIDGTIQFAQDGRAMALEQQRAATALRRIIDSPDKLSSDKLYQEAQQILARAEALEPRGPQLARQIEDVRQILQVYAEPVPVILRSDNRTEVTLSTVGTLGSFEEKRVELRPGAYTVIGSRDGCRDVREQIVVRPNMSPVDIRCVEAL
ncbi:MAG TPA: hypothetical protein VF210_09435 [Pseudomonadales bacterium]